MFVAPVPPDTPDEDQSADPPPGDRPLHDHQVAAGQRLGIRTQPLLGESQRESDAGLPDGHDRQDQDRRSSATRSPRSTTSNRASYDWMQNPPPADRYAGSQGQIRGHPVPSRADDQHLLLLDEHDRSRRSTTSKSARRSTTRSTRRRWNGSTPASSKAPTRSCRRGCRATKKFDLYPHDMAKAKEMIKEANPSDMDITVWTDTESPNNEAGDILRGRAQGNRLQREAENPQRRQLLHGDRQRRRRRTSTPAGRTGSRTTRTRTTSSSRCWPAKASCRPTTATSPTSTNPTLNKEIAELGEEQLGPEQEAAYAELDKKYMEQAPWAPYGTRTLSTFVSERHRPRQRSSTTRRSSST